MRRTYPQLVFVLTLTTGPSAQAAQGAPPARGAPPAQAASPTTPQAALPAQGAPAQPRQPPAPANATPPATPGTSAAYLKIDIESSRARIAMDTAAGLSAEVKNVSTVPVELYETETVFVTAPETQIYGDAQTIVGCARFPTQGNERDAVRPARGYKLVLQPNDSYRVSWDMSANGCTDQAQQKKRFWNSPLRWAEEKWQRIAFEPGAYRVYMNVLAYPQGQQPYRTITESRELQVSASQQMVLLGAFLGGLLAYVIKLYYGVSTPLRVQMDNTMLKTLLGRTEWLSAGLFGAGMAILASRLSDTFPVKVSANDFWGAITLGFVFQWLGVKLLEKLPGMGPSTTKPPTPPTPPAGTANP